MITKNDLANIANAIIDGANKEIEGRNLSKSERFAVRGAALASIANLWYDLAPNKVKEQYNYNYQTFLDSVWDKCK